MIRPGLVVPALALALPACGASAELPDIASSAPVICPQGEACSPCGDEAGEDVSAGEPAPISAAAPAPTAEGADVKAPDTGPAPPGSRPTRPPPSR